MNRIGVEGEAQPDQLQLNLNNLTHYSKDFFPKRPIRQHDAIANAYAAALNFDYLLRATAQIEAPGPRKGAFIALGHALNRARMSSQPAVEGLLVKDKYGDTKYYNIDIAEILIEADQLDQARLYAEELAGWSNEGNYTQRAILVKQRLGMDARRELGQLTSRAVDVHRDAPEAVQRKIEVHKNLNQGNFNEAREKIKEMPVYADTLSFWHHLVANEDGKGESKQAIDDATYALGLELDLDSQWSGMHDFEKSNFFKTKTSLRVFRGMIRGQNGENPNTDFSQALMEIGSQEMKGEALKDKGEMLAEVGFGQAVVGINPNPVFDLALDTAQVLGSDKQHLNPSDRRYHQAKLLRTMIHTFGMVGAFTRSEAALAMLEKNGYYKGSTEGSKHREDEIIKTAANFAAEQARRGYPLDEISKMDEGRFDITRNTDPFVRKAIEFFFR
jgi:hypothetical protein